MACLWLRREKDEFRSSFRYLDFGALALNSDPSNQTQKVEGALERVIVLIDCLLDR